MDCDHEELGIWNVSLVRRLGPREMEENCTYQYYSNAKKFYYGTAHLQSDA